MTLPAVDVHQHLWPEGLISGLSRRGEPPCLRGNLLRLPGMPDSPVDLDDHRPERRLRRLDRDGTDVAVISLQPTLGLVDGDPLVAVYHEGIAEVVRASDGRLAALAHGEARDGFAGATLAAGALARGLLEGSPPALLSELEARGGFLFVHPGPARQPEAAPRWWSEVASYTAEMQAAYLAWVLRGADAFPALRVVFAVLAGGAPIQLERLASRGVDARAARRETVFLDTASYGRRALELALATFGVGQLVFGSDVPVLDAAPGLRAVGEFGNAVTDAIRRENPSQLLG